MTQLITTNSQQHVSNVTDDVGITLLHLSPNVITLRSLLHLRPNVITLRSLLHLRAVITFRSSTHAVSHILFTTLHICIATLNLILQFLVIRCNLGHHWIGRPSRLLLPYEFRTSLPTIAGNHSEPTKTSGDIISRVLLSTNLPPLF